MRKVLLSCLVILLVVSPSFASGKPYYYYQGKKQTLETTNLIAVRLNHGMDIKMVFVDQKISALPKITQFEEFHLWLLEFNLPLRPEDLNLLSRRIASHPVVEFATPVLSSGNELLIVMDELVVKEKPTISRDPIYFAYSHSLIPLREGAVAGTWIWKVTKQAHLNALEIGNIFVEQGIAEYAHPNFLRIKPSR